MKHVNPETEWVVLGCLIDCEGVARSNASDLLNAAGLTVNDFTLPAVRAWYEAIRTLVDRSRTVDASTVWSISRGMPGVPEDGNTKLLDLQGANSCNKPALLTHAQELRRLTSLRKLEAFHQEQLKELQKGSADPAALASKLDSFSRNFAGTEEDFGTGEDNLFRISEEWDAEIAGVRKSYLPTGIELLDGHILGWEENLNIVGGAPSLGKSALIGTAISNALEAGHRICVFGLEDGTKWIPKRLLSKRIGMPIKHVGRLSVEPEERAEIQAHMGELANTMRNLLTYDRGGLQTGKLVQLCKKAIASYQVRAIYIDHGLEIQHEGLNKGDELRTRIQNTFQQLRDLAFTTHTPIIVVAHFNRDQAKNDGAPTMAQFAECAGIERMARLAIGLWEKEGDQPDEVRCTIIKQTEGERGVHLLLKRELKHALILSIGGRRIDLRAEKAARKASRNSATDVW